MSYPDPALEPPFLGGIVPANDADFPVQITDRARKRLFWHIVNSPTYAGPGILFELLDSTGAPGYRFGDVAHLSADEYWISAFGRVPVALPRGQESFFAGKVLDCRSFPPGPCFFLLKDRSPGGSFAPGHFRLSLDKLKHLHPELFRPASLLTKVLTSLFTVTSQLGSQPDDPSWRARWLGPWDPEGQAEAIEAIAQKLWAFEPEPAVVLSEDPFVVGAYSAEIDGTILLHFPQQCQKQGPKGRAWLIGDRMISCNGYDGMEDPSGDIALGPRSGGGWNECWPVVADLLTDDLDLLEARKRLIPGELWSRCKEQGSLRLARGDRARDGRPWHSRVAIRDQKKKEWRAPGGYLGSR